MTILRISKSVPRLPESLKQVAIGALIGFSFVYVFVHPLSIIEIYLIAAVVVALLVRAQ
jgi:hypothetical protein